MKHEDWEIRPFDGQDPDAAAEVHAVSRDRGPLAEIEYALPETAQYCEV